MNFEEFKKTETYAELDTMDRFGVELVHRAVVALETSATANAALVKQQAEMIIFQRAAIEEQTLTIKKMEADLAAGF